MSRPWASTARPAGLIAMALAASLVGIWLGEAVTESWFLVLSVLVGIALGSLGLLMVGHLLGDIWLEPVRAELEAASLTMPLLAVLALPLAFGLEQLYPWATDSFAAKVVPPVRRALYEPSGFVLRGAAYLACWTALALWIARPGSHRAASAVGLVLISVTTSLAAVDWFMSREPLFWSTLYGFAFAVSQLLAALAGAIAIALLRPGHPEAERLRSLERVLLTLAILALWVWFAQYIVIWLDQPPGRGGLVSGARRLGLAEGRLRSAGPRRRDPHHGAARREPLADAGRLLSRPRSACRPHGLADPAGQPRRDLAGHRWIRGGSARVRGRVVAGRGAAQSPARACRSARGALAARRERK